MGLELQSSAGGQPEEAVVFNLEEQRAQQEERNKMLRLKLNLQSSVMELYYGRPVDAVMVKQWSGNNRQDDRAQVFSDLFDFDDNEDVNEAKKMAVAGDFKKAAMRFKLAMDERLAVVNLSKTKAIKLKPSERRKAA